MNVRWILAVVMSMTAGSAHIQAEEKADPGAIAGLIKQLGSDKPTERAAAGKKLDAIGEPALELLKEASILSKSDEVRKQADELFHKIYKRVLPVALSAKESAEGWLLLFDGQSTFGWKDIFTDGKWTVKDGKLIAPAEKPGLLVTTSEFGQCQIKLEYRRLGKESKCELVLGCDAKGKNGGLKIGAPPIDEKGWLLLAVDLKAVDGKLKCDFEAGPVGGAADADGTGAFQGKIATGHVALSGRHIEIRSIKLRPLALESIFNGKNLTGWKVFKGNPGREKSTFAVSKEGFLEIKNGPGDIQSKGSYDNFVLQLECRTNGKYLNSGIFFRCLPAEYQQGYEVQIRNQCADGLRGKPVDFGTGGIYRRQPSRRVVSFDRDWFTMTLIADGRHFSVWVNGYQTADWTDTRPEGKNARQACCLGKGPISFQGHDPTTDLSFRNIRIAPLATRK